jgi:hypothetical protein
VVREPDKGRRVEIKVGQQVDMITGRVKEPFERPQAVAPAPNPAQRERGFVSKRSRAPSSSRDEKRSDDMPQEEPSQEKAQQ